MATRVRDRDPADMYRGGRLGRILAGMRFRLDEWLDRDHARDDYFAGDEAMRGIWKRLALEADPAKRADVFYAAADILHGMADVHRKAFGPDPIEWEDGRDMADSTELSADLMFALGRVEDAVADPAYDLDEELTGGLGLSIDTPAVRAVLHRMAATPGVRERAAIAGSALYDAVVPLVGGQAAETVSSVPAPAPVAEGSGSPRV